MAVLGSGLTEAEGEGDSQSARWQRISRASHLPGEGARRGRAESSASREAVAEITGRGSRPARWEAYGLSMDDGITGVAAWRSKAGLVAGKDRGFEHPLLQEDTGAAGGRGNGRK